MKHHRLRRAATRLCMLACVAAWLGACALGPEVPPSAASGSQPGTGPEARSEARSEAGSREPPPASLRARPDRLPALFEGTLPCADCPGIRHRLNLFADQSFYLRQTYLDRPDGSFDDIGRWLVSTNGRVLLLAGGREAPLRLRIVDADALRLLDTAGRDIASPLDYTLRRAARFERLEPRLNMAGMYRYMADAGLFDECLSGQRWPVAMLADNAALERAYVAARPSPAAPLLATLEGRVALLPKMEGSGLQPTLVVERFGRVWPDRVCAPPLVNAPFGGTRWALTELNGRPVALLERPPYLVFREDDRRVAGLAGCNRLVGGYERDQDRLSFGAHMAVTRMVCREGMDVEGEFLAVLRRVERWNVLGPLLELHDAAGVRVARFEARPSP